MIINITFTHDMKKIIDGYEYDTDKSDVIDVETSEEGGMINKIITYRDPSNRIFKQVIKTESIDFIEFQVSWIKHH